MFDSQQTVHIVNRQPSRRVELVKDTSPELTVDEAFEAEREKSLSEARTEKEELPRYW
jgi:hypothetical protein